MDVCPVSSWFMEGVAVGTKAQCEEANGCASPLQKGVTRPIALTPAQIHGKSP